MLPCEKKLKSEVPGQSLDVQTAPSTKHRNQGALFTPAPQVATATLLNPLAQPNPKKQPPATTSRQRRIPLKKKTLFPANPGDGHPATPGHGGTVTTPATHTMMPATAETFQLAPPVFWGREWEREGRRKWQSHFPIHLSHLFQSPMDNTYPPASQPQSKASTPGRVCNMTATPWNPVNPFFSCFPGRTHARRVLIVANGQKPSATARVR